MIQVQKTIPILIDRDAALLKTVLAFQAVKQTISPIAFNEGNPLRAVPLQRACYHQVKGSLNSQMTITALRLVAGAYESAKRNKRPAKAPFTFQRPSAMFLIGARGRDARFTKDGKISIWTVAGRKRISFTISTGRSDIFSKAVEFDSLTVLIRNGKLEGKLTVTLEFPDAKGIHPVGVDLNESNALVATDTLGKTLFISGLRQKVANIRVLR